MENHKRYLNLIKINIFIKEIDFTKNSLLFVKNINMMIYHRLHIYIILKIIIID